MIGRAGGLDTVSEPQPRPAGIILLGNHDDCRELKIRDGLVDMTATRKRGLRCSQPPLAGLTEQMYYSDNAWPGPRGVAGYTEALAFARHVCQLPSRILDSLQCPPPWYWLLNNHVVRYWLRVDIARAEAFDPTPETVSRPPALPE
jgi:hypothetical protein